MLLPLLALCSCTDDWKFSTDSGYVLGFSADTVCFDTVFTGVASASAEFRIYNPNDVGLRFDALMGGGSANDNATSARSTAETHDLKLR